jgi:hypothetical protein
MKHTLKILLAVIVFTFIGGVAQAQEATMTQRFTAEETSSVNPMVENMAKLKGGVGVHFSQTAVFGVSVGKGVKVGFNVKF